jgi:S1-C subfamily serine protease
MRSKLKKNWGNLVLFIIIVLITVEGYYSIEQVRQDYIKGLEKLSSDFQEKIQEQQKEINQLQSELKNTSQQIGETQNLYKLEFGKLNQRIGDIEVESESFTQIISEKINSVVSILTNLGQGSGAIISAEGYIITNYHVIDGISQAGAVTYEGTNYAVRLIEVDENQDLALLKMVTNDTFDFFEFGDSDNLHAGQKVVALGNPAGLSFTATEGIISSPTREITGDTFIQTDVTINPGNSGGPLINSAGKIIGIVNFKISDFEELGFAIPSNRVKKFIDDSI